MSDKDTAAPAPDADVRACMVSAWSSAMCSRGTKGCTMQHHDVPAPDAATVELPPLPDIEQEVYARTRTFLRNDEIVAVGQLMEVYASEAIRTAVEQLCAENESLRREQPKAIAWVVSGPGGGVYHLSVKDGWTVDPVVFDAAIEARKA